MPNFSPIKLPRNPDECAPWLYEALSRLSRAASSSSQGMAAILRGEAPDGSGSSLVDTSRFFYKPGLSGGQVAYGGTGALDDLVLSSTSAASKGTIFLGSALTSGYDESNDRLGLGTVTPAGKVHLVVSSGVLARLETAAFTVANCTISGTSLTTTGTFLPAGGPSVRPGMLVTGTGIPAGTYVQTISSGTSLTMTQAGTSGTITASFQTFVDIQQKSDETGRDIEWLSHGAVRFTPGTGGVPFSIVGDRSAMASGLTVTDHIYLEAGYVSTGSGIGTDLQIGGPNRGELGNMNILSKTLWLARNPNVSANSCVAVGVNPASFGGGFGPGAHFTGMSASGRPAIALYEGTGSYCIGFYQGTSGTSPNLALSGLMLSVYAYQGRIQFHQGTSTVVQYIDLDTAGVDNGSIRLVDVATNNVMVLFRRTASWSDSAVCTHVVIDDANRALIHGRLNAVLLRLGMSSQYTLISNGSSTAGNTNFPSPDGSGSPTTLRVYDAATGGFDAGVVCKIETARTGKTGDLLQLISAVGSTVNTAWNCRNVMVTGRIKTAVLFTDDNATIASAKLLGLSVANITAGQTRTWTAQDIDGTVDLVLATSRRTGLTANDVSATTVYTTPKAGLYRVSVTTLCTTADIANSNIQVTVTWNDGTARSHTFYKDGHHNLDELDEVEHEYAVLYMAASSAITIQCVNLSAGGSPVWDLVTTVEAISV